MRWNVDRIIINISAGIGVIHAEDASFIILADIVSYDDIVIACSGAHPEQTVIVVVAVAVLKHTLGAFQICIVQRTVPAYRMV